jgi:glutamyl-tRNA reductase
MARLAALAIRRRGLALQVASRTPGRAAALASELGGVHVGFRGDADGTPPDGVIVALAGPWPVDDSAVDRLARAGTTLVDLSSPPALSATQRTRLGGAYVSVDALAATSEDEPDARLRLRLDRVVSRVGADYCAWLRTREAVPAITALVNTAEARRSEELAWLRRRLPDLTDEELAAVEQMSHRLVAAMLHAPLTALTRDDDGELEPAARTLFGV